MVSTQAEVNTAALKSSDNDLPTFTIVYPNTNLLLSRLIHVYLLWISTQTIFDKLLCLVRDTLEELGWEVQRS